MSGKVSGKSKSGKAAGGEPAAKSTSRSAKAGLQFPVGRVHRLLKKGNYAQRVGAGAPGQWYLTAAVLSRLTSFSFAQFTSLPSSNTLLLRFSNSLATPLVITRSTVSFLVIFNWPSATMRSECCHVLLFMSHLSCRRLGKLLGDVVISQGGVGEYCSCLFFLISNSFVQCPISHLNFCQRRRARGRRKVKRLSRSWVSSHLLYLLLRWSTCILLYSLVTLFKIFPFFCLSRCSCSLRASVNPSHP